MHQTKLFFIVNYYLKFHQKQCSSLINNSYITAKCLLHSQTSSSSSSSKVVNSTTATATKQHNLSKSALTDSIQSRDQISIIPHPVSKLRLVRWHIPVNETKRQRALRLARIELQQWNHQYWTKNNEEFNRQKKEFIRNELLNKAKQQQQQNVSNNNQTATTTKTPTIIDTEVLVKDVTQSHEELAEFYKKFLDENRAKHIAYNFEWYRRNIRLLWPTFVVQLERIFLATIGKGSKKKNHKSN